MMKNRKKMNEQKKEVFWPLIATIFLGTFAVMLSSSTINIALSYLMEHFNTDLDHVKWTMTGFMLAMGVTAPLTAYFGEKFSYKNLYVFSITGFTLVSLSAVFANSIAMVVVIRVLQGCFGGVTLPATMAIMYQVIPKEKQVLAVSLWNIAPSLAPALGPTISGFLLQYFSWKAIFTINGVFGIITVFLAIRYLPFYKLSKHVKFDAPGIFFSLVTGASLLTAFSEGAIWGWKSTAIMLLLITGVITMIVFIFTEFKSKSPALDLRVFQYPRFTAGLIVSIVINVTVYAGTLITPIFFQQIQNVDPLRTGLYMLPPTLVMALIMPMVGKLLNKFGAFPLVILGIVLVSLGTFKLTFLEVDTSVGYIMVWMMIRYIGVSLTTMPVNYLSIAALPKEVSGHGSSILNWMKQMFSCLSVGIFSSMLTVRMSYHILMNQQNNTLLSDAVGSVEGINDVYRISCIIVLFALPFAFILQQKKKTNEVADV